MEIDFSKLLYELNGDVIQVDGTRCPKCGQFIGGDSKDLDLRTVVARALMVSGQGVPDAIPQAERGLLALKIFDSEEPVELTTDRLSGIKKYIGHAWGTIVVSQTDKLLEGKDNPFDPANR